MFETWWEGKGFGRGDGESSLPPDNVELDSISCRSVCPNHRGRPKPWFVKSDQGSTQALTGEPYPQNQSDGEATNWEQRRQGKSRAPTQGVLLSDGPDFESLEQDDELDPTAHTADDEAPAWRTRLRRVAQLSLGAGLGGTALVLGASWGARTYIQEQLIPQIEATLSQRLNRRVDLGSVSYVWPWQVTLRHSSVENLANIRAVDLSIDLPHWIRTREVIANVRIHQPTILVMETLDRGWADLQISEGDAEGGGIPISRVNLSLVDGQLTAQPLYQDPQTLTQLTVQGHLDLTRLGSPLMDEQAMNEDATGEGFEADAQFRAAAQLQDRPVRLRGEFDLLDRDLRLTGSAQGLDLALIPAFVSDLPLETVAGQANLDLALEWQPQVPVDLRLMADVRASQLQIRGVPLPFGEVRGELGLDWAQKTLTLTEVDALYGRIPLVATGAIGFGQADPPGYRIEAEVAGLGVEELLQTFELDLPAEVAGRLAGSVFLTGALDQPVLGGLVRGTSGRVVLPGSQDPLLLSGYETGFVLQGSQLRFDQIVAQVAGGLITGQGQVSLAANPVTRFELQASGLDPTLITALYGEIELPVELGRVDGLTTVEITGGSPRVGADLTLAGGEITGTGRIEIADGETRLARSLLFWGQDQGRVAATATLRQGQLSGILSPRDLNLERFGVEGPISADLNIGIPLAELNLGGLQAQGSVQFPDGLLGIALPLRGRVAWDGTGIQIESGSVAGLVEIEGRIPVDNRSFEIGALDLRLRAEDVDITQLPELDLPPALEARGILGLEAQLQGRPQALSLTGDLDLRDLGARDLTFEQLQGSVAWGVGQGGEVNLQGVGQDRVLLTVSPNFQDIQFQLQQGSITALGSRQGELLKAEVREVPMELLTGGAPGVTGRASGNVVVNLAQDMAEADATIAGLQLGDLEARQVSVALQFQDDQLQIPAASLQLFDSVYSLTGTVNLPSPGAGENRSRRNRSGPDQSGQQPIPELDLSISTQNGSLEDIVATFKWLTWEDLTLRGVRLPALGPAELIVAQPQGDPSASLLDQLQLFEQVVAALAAEAEQQTDALWPQPPSLQGSFEARLDLEGSLDQLGVGFQLSGQNWRAEEFGIDSVMAAGSYGVNGVGLEIAQLDLVSGERSGRFSGQLSGTQQMGSLQLERIPLGIFERFWPQGLELTGDLDAQVELSGNLSDPRLEGQFDLATLQVNQIPIQQAQAALSYGDGQLELDSTLIVEQEDPPIQIVGTVPYAPAFTLAAQQIRANGVSPQIDLNLKVPGEGLRLLNLLTDQVSWESGESDLRLEIKGTLREPTLQGSLTLDQGVMQVTALPDPITGITGEVVFDLDRLLVDDLTAFYGGGSLVMGGTLPVNTRGAQALEADGFAPLNLSLNGINLVLPSATNGDRLNTELNGSVFVGGLLLRPLLLGQVSVSNGILDIGGGTDPETNQLLPQTEQVEDPDWMPRFEDLRLAIGPGMEVRRGQLFSFNTRGELRVFGTPLQPQLAGSLNLDGGRLNLPLANFRIDRSQTNRVTFNLDHGLDPTLDLHLSRRASEVSPPLGRLSSFGSQTIDIRARVEGRASELSLDDPRPGIVSLSSIPPRSEDEIFAILGSNVLATLGTSAGVAGLAGQGLISNFEDFLTDNLGLDEIRVGPVPLITGSSTQGLALGVEVARDLGTDISISAQQLFSNPVQPTRFGARYRLHPNLLLRLSADMNGTSAAAVEFETRF